MSDGDQLERLTALMVQQSEQAAQREERLASMLERALASQEQQLVTRSDTAVAEGGQSAGAESGRSTGRSAGTVATAALSARLPAGTITAPHLYIFHHISETFFLTRFKMLHFPTFAK